MEFRIGSAVWRFSESNLFLQWVNTSGPTTQLFESHSTSNDFSFDSFPNYAGSFNVGFFIRDENHPLEFWDTADIESTVFDVGNFTSGGGGISTALADDDGDLIDGYSLGFNVTNLTITTIPEPSVIGLMLGFTTLTLSFRRKNRTGR